MRFVSRAALGAAAIAGVLCLGTSAHAYRAEFTVSKCLSAKIKTEAKGVSAYAGCHAKGASKGVMTDPACLTKTSGKNTSAFGKLDVKNQNCLTTGDGVARDNDAAAYAVALDTAVGHAAGKCDTAKTKNVGKYIAAIGGCYAKAAGKAPGLVDNAIGGCTDKSKTKLINAITKAEDNPDCSNPGNGLALLAAADAFLTAQSCILDPGALDCAPDNCAGGAPNGVLDAGEDCDPNGGGATSCATVSNAGGTCTDRCNCTCPRSVTFSGDATQAASVLDTGWTGLGHRAPIIANGDVTVALSCSGFGYARPCGTCTLAGPIDNPGVNKLKTHRCSDDSSIQCADDGDCDAPATCVHYFGSTLPLVAGGVGTCVSNAFDGSIQGTANVESGESVTTVFLTSSVFTGPTDNPCPRCVGDGPTANDGNPAGTCDAGPHQGDACDVNGSVPGRPSFGSTSLDCPPDTGLRVAVLSIDLSSATDPVTKTLTASSPDCSDGSGLKCLCETCGNATMNACDSNADCTSGVCGGKRCIGGTNEGTACVTSATCTGGGLCGTKGEPSKVSACLDDTTSPGVFDCSDTVPVDGEGACVAGPVTKKCSVASGFGHRQCNVDADCGGGAGTCQAGARPCFLTGGGAGLVGSGTLTAAGMEDAPMTDTSSPTLGAVFCVAPTDASAVNIAAGLPGPGRVTIKGTAVGIIPQ